MNDALSADTVGPYLIERGVVPPKTRIDVGELSGGVSSVVLDVRARDRRLVVKQPLELFRVPNEWRAKRERVLVEAAALELASRIVPGAAPQVVDVDRERLVMVMEGAPEGWRSWKEELLSGTTREDVAARAGAILAAWHASTQTGGSHGLRRATPPDPLRGGVLARFEDPEIFAQQRVDPYYRTTMARRPELAEGMRSLLDRMLATSTCLVHGDWSPKNVLTGPDALWIIDWEITHAGDPAFDLAFMTNHLMLKAIHRPAAREGYERCARGFWSAYGDIADAPYVLGHVGCLMVARVDGKSPAEYLTGRQRLAARELGSSLLMHPPVTIEDAWMRLRG